MDFFAFASQNARSEFRGADMSNSTLEDEKAAYERGYALGQTMRVGVEAHVVKRWTKELFSEMRKYQDYRSRLFIRGQMDGLRDSR